MTNHKKVNLYNAGPIVGYGPEPRFDWQCKVLSLLTETKEDEVVKTLNGFIDSISDRLHSSLMDTSAKCFGENSHPYIDRAYMIEALLPLLVRTIDITVDLIPPLTILERAVISKDKAFENIYHAFCTAEASLPARFENRLNAFGKERDSRDFYAAFEMLSMELRSEINYQSKPQNND